MIQTVQLKKSSQKYLLKLNFTTVVMFEISGKLQVLDNKRNTLKNITWCSSSIIPIFQTENPILKYELNSVQWNNTIQSF